MQVYRRNALFRKADFVCHNTGHGVWVADERSAVVTGKILESLSRSGTGLVYE